MCAEARRPRAVLGRRAEDGGDARHDHPRRLARIVHHLRLVVEEREPQRQPVPDRRLGDRHGEREEADARREEVADVERAVLGIAEQARGRLGLRLKGESGRSFCGEPRRCREIGRGGGRVVSCNPMRRCNYREQYAESEQNECIHVRSVTACRGLEKLDHRNDFPNGSRASQHDRAARAMPKKEGLALPQVLVTEK